MKDFKTKLERVITLEEQSQKSQGLFGWEDCQVEKGERSYGKGKCYTYDIIATIASQPIKGEGKKDSPIKTIGRFGSLIGGVAKEEIHGIKCNCCREAFNEPTIMLLKKEFEEYQKVQQKEYKLLKIVTQEQMVELEAHIDLQ